ncbi:MAG: diguanylate cyclase, partial [Planctomycetes bacterium]|nr:diguanylate cyclase [Planctomycetota bacterium]
MAEDLSKLVFKDELTDLYNRRFLYSYLKEQIKPDDPKCCVSLMMIDIDFFKQVNDTYGHLEGDNILKQLAQVIRDVFTDKIKDLTEAHNIRYAGDEFTVVLPNIDKPKAVAAAEKLRQAIAATPFKRREAGQEPLSLKVSIGIASAPVDAKTPDDLIDQADKALYFSKQNGRNKVAAAGSFNEASILEKTLFNTFPCPTFVGQEALFTEMLSHIRSMNEGQNFFYLVEGPTGHGKTRLLRELEKSGGNDFLPLLTVCDETDKFTPYKSISNLLKRLELPAPVDQPVSNSEEDRKSLFDNITAQLTKLSQTKPLLIMLDEFQYADDGTMEVINFFAENAQGRIIMIFAVRDEILAKAAIFYPRLDNFMADMSVSSNFKRLTVTPFDQQYTSMMVAGILPGHPVIPGFTQKIYETLKNFILKKYILRKEAGWQIDINNIKEADWQRDVNELINENVSLLEAGTREIVKRATVVGRELDVAVLAGVAHQNETETMEMLDKAKQMHIIEPIDPSKSDKFAFVNKRAQEVIYQNIEEKERQSLHYEAGEITRKIHKDDLEKVAGALAFHYDKGGDEKKAEQFGKLAETEANKYFRPDEANNYFDHKRSIIRSKIKEAVQPLNSDQLNIMKDVLRGLLTTAKNMKLYPDGSQLITFSTGGLIKSMNNIFAQIESITLSEAKGELNINTAPVDIKAFGTAPAEFSAMMKD